MDKVYIERLEKIELSLNKAISIDFTKDWQFDSFGNLSPSLKKEYIQNIIQPNKELIDLGGKRWRPLLLILCYELNKTNSQLTEEQAYSLTPLVEFVHTASLIHDDIEDSADFRRGKPSAYITYGLDTALNAASWLYFEAPVCINKLNAPDSFKLELYGLYTKELRRLHLGQAMDIFWHSKKDFFPNIAEYQQMVTCKTGTLASLSAKCGYFAGGNKIEEAEKLGEIAANIGMGFQIIDDVQNLTTGNVGKKRGDDIVEGKKSLPVLLHIQEAPSDKEELCSLMTQAYNEGIESAAVEKAISLLEKSGSIKKAASERKKLIQESCNSLVEFAPSNKETALLIQNLFISMIPKEYR